MLSSPTIKCALTAVEVLEEDSLSSSGRSVQHTVFDRTITPSPATIYSGDVYALSSGAKSIDLRALYTVGNGLGDANGLKLQGMYFKNLGANPMTIVGGASNGYDLFGASGSVAVPAGGVLVMFFNDASPDVSGTDKTIDISGTGSQTFELALILG